MNTHLNGILVLRCDTLIPGQAVITSRPQHTAFRGRRLAIPDSIARCFDVLDYKVGNKSQLPGSVPISAELFATRLEGLARLSARTIGDVICIEISEKAIAEFGKELRQETCQAAMDVSIHVQLKPNREPSPFEAWVFGTVADDYYHVRR